MQLRDVAVLEEARLRLGMSEIAMENIPIADGVATRGESGTWINSATGIGMSGPVTTADIDRLIEFHRDWKAEPRIEVCPFADRSLVEALKSRGFNLQFFENTLFRDFSLPAPPPPPSPPGLEIRTVDPTNPAQVREFATTACIGFGPVGMTPRDEAIALAERCATHPRSAAYTAYLEGRAVCAGALEVSGNIAALFGLSVLHDFRGRGIQTAMITHRVMAARERGATVATIGAAPGIGTERNARRAGFQVAYTRVFMNLPGPGLEPARF
jgi:GNAT superfamily N-acetyltransferase